MRRLIAARKLHGAMGRGALTFLYPRNRKVLAYLRSGEEAILCIANMSQAPQSAELDLSAFKGRVPVELLGRSAFPPIGDLPYFYYVPGYGYYWFLLAEEAEAPKWHEPSVVPLPEFHTLVLRAAGDSAVEEAMRCCSGKRSCRSFCPTSAGSPARDGGSSGSSWPTRSCTKVKQKTASLR